MVSSHTFDQISLSGLEAMMKELTGVEKIILSAVATVDPSLLALLRDHCAHFMEFTSSTDLPIRNNYLTPRTLGLDRLASAVGAWTLFPDKELLVIDAGTAITFDLIEKGGTFVGGNISVGLQSRFRALHEFTDKLPLVQVTEDYPLVGRTTSEAIQSGIIHGMTLEIDGMIGLMKKKYPEIQPVLTGGDALFFERRLKSPIFVKSEITLIGLNRILEYNVEKL